MKKIKDERLVIQNLKNIRVAFLVQTLGIILILVKDIIDGKEIFGTPLFFLFIVTIVVFNLISMGVSIDNEEPKRNSILNTYKKVILLSIVVGVVFTGLYVILSPERPLLEAFVGGLILFICFLSSFSIVYFIKQKRSQEFDD
jgi:hypothetical protein